MCDLDFYLKIHLPPRFDIVISNTCFTFYLDNSLIWNNAYFKSHIYDNLRFLNYRLQETKNVTPLLGGTNCARFRYLVGTFTENPGIALSAEVAAKHAEVSIAVLYFLALTKELDIYVC